jgi:membrane carboxypeptidase/penicillin-binding protein
VEPEASLAPAVEPPGDAGALAMMAPEEAAPPLLPPLRGMEGIPAALRDLASIQGGRGYLPEKRLAPRVISPQNAWLMSDIMHDVATRGTARRTQSMGRDDLAGKTGTTDEARDNWFNGFTPALVASVWVGLDNYESLGEREEGATTAVPIWMSYMREALQETPPQYLPRPGGLVDVRISPVNGLRAHPLDPDAIVETFMVDQLPREPRPGEAGYLPPGVEPGAGESPGGGTIF